MTAPEDPGEALIHSLAVALLAVHERLVASGALKPGEVSAVLRSLPNEAEKPVLRALIEGLADGLDARPIGTETRTVFRVITGGRSDTAAEL